MKIVSWNCNGALRNKVEYLDELDADVLVVQECENPCSSTAMFKDWAGKYFWVGDNKNRGLGIFARKGHDLGKLEWNGRFQMPGISIQSSATLWTSNELQSFLPCMVDNKHVLLGVWTKKVSKSPNFRYVGQLWKYMQIHKADIAREEAIVCGDFNSNSIWDEMDRWWNHSDVVGEFAEIGYHSLYHSQENEAHGAESQNTFYMYRHAEKGYHIDYVFLPKRRLRGSSVMFGDAAKWLQCSDHVPLIINMDVG
ncbi:endonuclease/exonuclease/phosphatase family protein [Pontiella sp.]|uniref:endonuclease/exonuclease/phosphatase family protein n=1 Tax=Pontiella sp. TaxID=2837462 RepID=UPI003561888B